VWKEKEGNEEKKRVQTAEMRFRERVGGNLLTDEMRTGSIKIGTIF
jgi:hypothetical protein